LSSTPEHGTAVVRIQSPPPLGRWLALPRGLLCFWRRSAHRRATKKPAWRVGPRKTLNGTASGLGARYALSVGRLKNTSRDQGKGPVGGSRFFPLHCVALHFERAFQISIGNEHVYARASLQTGLRDRVTTPPNAPPKCDKWCVMVEKIEGRMGLWGR
jgi:hypothetical protein